MAVYRVERTRDYTVMSNYHLKDKSLSLKSKGLLSMILSLPDEWNYTTRGLSAICKEGVDAIGSALKELESAGYIQRSQLRDGRGRITDTEYIIYEQPQPDTSLPHTENPDMARSDMGVPCAEKPAQIITNPTRTNEVKTHSIGPSQVEERRAAVREQIEYEHLCDIADRARVDELVELMLEVALARSDTIKIGRDKEYPTAFVQQRLAMLDSGHVEFVLDRLDLNAVPVKNTRAYLLAALFNAPASAENYYTMAAGHHLRSGA